MTTNNFTVPTLSLSGSRMKKQNTSVVPTRDYSQYMQTYNYNSQNESNLQNKYSYKCVNHNTEIIDRNKRPAIFPPKQPTTNELNRTKDINKNVYLQYQEDVLPVTTFPNNYEQPKYNQTVISSRGLNRSSSRNGLLTNPQSSKQIQEQMHQRQVIRKLDVNKVLFDRKLNKLFEQANFYDEQLQSACQDELGPKLQELIVLKQEQINSHKELIMELTALIK